MRSNQMYSYTDQLMLEWSSIKKKKKKKKSFIPQSEQQIVKIGDDRD